MYLPLSQSTLEASRPKCNPLGTCTGSPRLLQCLRSGRDCGSDNAAGDMGPLSQRLKQKNGLGGQRRSLLKCTCARFSRSIMWHSERLTSTLAWGLNNRWHDNLTLATVYVLQT